MAEWLSLHALLHGPGFGSWAQTWHCSLGHAEAASHMPQLEGPTTRIYNYVLGGFGENKGKNKILKKKSSVSYKNITIQWNQENNTWTKQKF